MKYRITQIILPLTAVLVASTPMVFAQMAPERMENASSESAIELSPFTVDAAADEGYTSSVSTSGSRLKTDLKDLAASVTVLTDDFMNDLAANDIASALAFISGAENDSTYHQENVAELGGPNGYVGGDFGDNNNRSGEVRVRGLGRATTTINFIEVLGSTDRYNTERSEFLRGANSILFGLAEPAGLINSSTKVANLRRNLNKIETRLDDHGSARLMLDFSRPLIRDKLALRAVGLYSDTRFKVDTARQRDKRLFVTTTYQPFRGTTLRAYYERTRADGRRPNFRTVQDNVSEWLDAYNTYAPRMTQAQIDQAFFWDPTAPSANGTAGNSTFTLTDGTSVNLGLIRRPLDSLDRAALLIYSGNVQWLDPLDNLMTLAANRTTTGAAASPVNSRSIFMRTGSARENNPNFGTDPQVTDRGIFPYETVEIGALPGSYRWENDGKVFLNLDQRITPDLYLSASFQHEERDHEQYFATITQTNQISVDVNRKLPDGRANPNFLRPFVYGRSIGEYSDAEARNFVVQANYDLDFAKKTERLGWLGSHRLTAVYTDAEVDRLTYRWHNMLDGQSPALQGAAADPTNPARWAMQMWYVGDAVQLGDDSLRFTGFPTTLSAHQGRSYDFLYYNNTVNPRAWQLAPEPMSVDRQLIAGGRSYTVQKNTGVGVSLQSFFWDQRIVTLFGWREDEVESFQGVPRPDSDFPFPTVAGLDRSQYEAVGSIYDNKGQTSTQSIVFKATPNIRLFANRSENFAATTPRQDNLYRPLPPQSGETEDFGIGLTFMDGRLDIRATRFQSSQVGATSSTGVAGLRIVAFEELIYNALGAAGRLSEYSTIDELGNPTSEVYARPNNAASTEDRVSEGTSVEISFRPNRNWDFVASVDQLDNVVTNVGSEIGEFLALRAPFYGKYFDEGLRVDGTNAGTSDLLETRFANVVASNYVNELLKEGISNRGISEYTAKVVGRYKFTGGRLNGLTIGANLRWESGKVLGYARKTESFNFGGLENYPGTVSDTDVEYTGDSVIAGGMFVSYARRIFDGRVNWRIQLNAQDLFSEQGLRVFAANGDGSPIWSMAPARTFQLTNSFDF